MRVPNWKNVLGVGAVVSDISKVHSRRYTANRIWRWNCAGNSYSSISHATLAREYLLGVHITPTYIHYPLTKCPKIAKIWFVSLFVPPIRMVRPGTYNCTHNTQWLSHTWDSQWLVSSSTYLVPLAKNKEKVIFPTRKGKQQQREPKKRGCTPNYLTKC